MYLYKYAIICKKETSSSLDFGGLHSHTALTLLGLGFSPSAVNRCPWKSIVDLPNSHFSLRKVTLSLSSRCNKEVRLAL